MLSTPPLPRGCQCRLSFCQVNTTGNICIRVIDQAWGQDGWILAKPHPENRILVTIVTLSKFRMSTWSIKYIFTFKNCPFYMYIGIPSLPPDKKFKSTPKFPWSWLIWEVISWITAGTTKKWQYKWQTSAMIIKGWISCCSSREISENADGGPGVLWTATY